MTEEQLRELRAYYHSLRGQDRVFESAKHPSIEHSPVLVLTEEIARLEKAFPGLVPPFKPDEHVSHRGDRGPYYVVAGILSYLAVVLGKLQVAVETGESTPVTQTRQFDFIKEAALRTILERDYREIQKAFIAECWKSVIIMSGGAIEAMLTDLLLQDSSRAKSAKKAPKDPDITRWDLAQLIDVAVELGLVNKGVDTLSHSVREYRNLVHPGNEIRQKLSIEAEEAKIALEVLHMVHRDLSK